MKKTGIMCCAVLLAGCMLCSCGEQSSSDVTTIESEDLPYGATITYNPAAAVPMQYDKRFIDEKLQDTIAAYYYAVQTNDAEKFSAALFPLYHEYELEILYEGQVTDAEIVEASHTALKERCGGDFAFSLIDVTDVIVKDDVSTYRDALKGMLDDLAEEADMEPVSEKTAAFYEMTVKRYLTDAGSGEKGETETSLVDETLYALHWQGQWYLIYT